MHGIAREYLQENKKYYMKGLSTLVAVFFISGIIYAQKYTPIDSESKVHFVIKNFGIKIGGDFTDLKGSIIFDPNTLSTGLFNLSVNSNTINTDNNTRDKHLRKEEYFYVEKYPLLSFVSTKITKSALAGEFNLHGNLTIKGVTKNIEFGFKASPTASGYNFKGEFEINRRDFGVGGSSLSLSDNLKISINIFAKK
jgi:polyisoprenoid-binding protein YceI